MERRNIEGKLPIPGGKGRDPGGRDIANGENNEGERGLRALRHEKTGNSTLIPYFQGNAEA